MNNWRGNLHPRGGDSDHPGRFSKGHGGRHYNPPPGLEHLAMHHPDQHRHHRARCVRELGDAGQEIV